MLFVNSVKVLYTPQGCAQLNVERLWDGSTVYPKRLEYNPIADVITRRALSSQIFNLDIYLK